MTYTKRPDIVTGTDGESVVELDDESLVAVACRHLRCEITQGPVFEVSARWADAEGHALCDAHGAPVETRHRHHSTHVEVERHTLPAVVRACLCLVLGEPIETHDLDGEAIPVIAFSDEVRAHQSIRNAIVSAKRTFETVHTADVL